MLESLTNSERINIKDLSADISEQQKGAQFDAERDIPNEYRTPSLTLLEAMRSKKDWTAFLYFYDVVGRLYPDVRSLFVLSEEEKKEVERLFLRGFGTDKEYGVDKSYVYVEDAAMVKAYLGDIQDRQILSRLDEAWPVLRARASSEQAAWLLGFYCVNLKRLYPERILQEPLQQKQVNIIMETLYSNLSLNDFAALACNARLLWPERTPDLPLDGAKWAGMRSVLSGFLTNGHLRSALQLADRMQVLAAREVKITKKGIIELRFGQLIEDETPLPETRNF